MIRRSLHIIVLAIFLVALSSTAVAQTYPSKPIKIIVMSAPGSASDQMARYLVEHAGKAMGATFFAENIVGANGILAARALAKSAPDGHTIMISSNSPHAANLYLYKDLNYDPVKDFAPITGLTYNPYVLWVRSTLPVKSVAELIQYGKANPGKLSFGHGNTGALSCASLLCSKGGFTAVPVPFKAMPPAIMDLIAGRVDFITTDFFTVDTHRKSGAVRPLGVSSKTRLKIIPDVPTIAETIPGFEIVGWLATFAPAGTPPDIIAKLNETFTKILNSPDFLEYMTRQGTISFPTTPAELGKWVEDQIVKWDGFLKGAGVPRGQ